MNLTKLALLISVNLLLFSCQQNSDTNKKIDTASLVPEAKENVSIGQTSLNKDLFQKTGSKLYPIQNISDYDPIYSTANSSIEGIYVNAKFYEAFDDESGTIKKVDNAFDIVYIYPETRRYNFQIAQPSAYRIVHYLGFLYQDPSNRQNLPHFVKSIAKLSDNEVLFTYSDDSSLSSEATQETLKLTTYPKLKFEFSDKNLHSFQKSKEYIKLSKDVLNDITIKASANDLPQDLTELYMREIVTKLVNIKHGTNYKTEEIIEVLH